MGARIHRTVALQCVCERLQLKNLSAWVKFVCYIFRIDILYTQRCWWGCTKSERQIWRRNAMRRYVLVDEQSEYGFINWKGFMVSIFYIRNVVGDFPN